LLLEKGGNMARKKTRKRQVRYDALLFQHLEKVSGKLLTTYPDIVRDLIGRQAGVYALYKKERLYYVGLARKLSGRLRAHLRDRHKGCWDTFSIYLTNNDKHMKEIESLLLQIARPKGNKVGGKPSGSTNLKARLGKAVRVRKREEANALIGRYLKKTTTGSRRLRNSDRRTLPFLFPQGARLKGERNGKRASGFIARDGTVRVKGKSYDSLSAAGRAAYGASVNGWYFWRVQRGTRNWVRLRDIKNAGTPLLLR
jgi:hypothetical protein